MIDKKYIIIGLVLVAIVASGLIKHTLTSERYTEIKRIDKCRIYSDEWHPNHPKIIGHKEILICNGNIENYWTPVSKYNNLDDNGRLYNVQKTLKSDIPENFCS